MSRLAGTDYAQATAPFFRFNRRASSSAPAVSFSPPTTNEAPCADVAIGSGAGPAPRNIRGRTLAAAGLLHTEKTLERVRRSPHAKPEEGASAIPGTDRWRTREHGRVRNGV